MPRSTYGRVRSAHGLDHPTHGFGKTEGGRPPQNHGKRCFLVLWGFSNLVQPPLRLGPLPAVAGLTFPLIVELDEALEPTLTLK